MFIAAIMAFALSLAVCGAALLWITPREDRWFVVACVAGTLPMSWLMYHGVRMPLDAWLHTMLGEGDLLRWIRTAYAPLTEEPAKLWPLVLPWVRQRVTRESVSRFALALGLGFALGEIFTVASLFTARTPDTAALPWYLLINFIWERCMTCATHSGMTAVALAGWRRGPGIVVGLLSAMLSHYFANFPIAMAQRGWLGQNAEVSQMLVVLWVMGCAVAGVTWLKWLHFGKSGLGKSIYGNAVCPGCGQEYERGLWLALNFGPNHRYERCPHCRNWHWTTRKPGIAKQPPADGQPAN